MSLTITKDHELVPAVAVSEGTSTMFETACGEKKFAQSLVHEAVLVIGGDVQSGTD